MPETDTTLMIRPQPLWSIPRTTAFVTRNVITGRRGPHFSTAFNADHRLAVTSLAHLDGLAARHVLPGHGDAWSGGLAEALRLVRASVPAELRRTSPQS